jgi:hypothetical protein
VRKVATLLGMNSITGRALLPGHGSRNSTADKLVIMSGLTREQFMRTFDRRNVLDAEVWDQRSARQAGERLKKKLSGKVVVLGREVWRALGFHNRSDEWFSVRVENDVSYVLVPHPSGVSHWYNDAKNVKRVERFLRDLIAEKEKRS